jgi:Leucine-rich repeat (LRR) protein
LLIASTYAANMTCGFQGTTCSSIQTLTPSLTPNENIIVTNAPFQPYFDTVTTNINLFNRTGIQIKDFPGGIFKIYKNLQNIDMGYFTTALLGTDSINNCENLKSVSLGYCSIGRLGAGFARTCMNMTSFLIQFSNVGSIDANAFEGLKNLQKLYMYSDQIKCIPATLLNPIRSLTLLNLDNNPITSLNTQFFVGMPYLTSVGLHGTSMFYMPNFNFTGTSILPQGAQLQLIMYNNPIRSINPKLLDQLQARKTAGQNAIYIYFKALNAPIINCVNASASFANNLYIINGVDLSFQNTTFRTSTTCYSDVTEYMYDAFNSGCASGSCNV